MVENIKNLKRAAWITVVLLLAVMAGSHFAGSRNVFSLHAGRFNSFAGLMGTVIFSVALPIIIRLIFCRKKEQQRGLSFREFRLFKLLSLGSVCLGSIFAAWSLLIPVFRYHLYLSVLAALYGIYSVLPFQRSLVYDLKIYGVSDEVN